MTNSSDSTAQTRQTGDSIDAVSVLVVDDNPTNRLLCSRSLTKKGFVVREATDGCEALIQVRRELPDVILMDVLMPKMDGLECTRRLRASAETSDIPIIILSACKDADDITAGLEAGADEYLGKPLRVAELEVRLRSMVRLFRDRKEIIRAREAQAATRAMELELAERRHMEESLRLAKDAAETANLAKSEFLATMSHELRTPLNGVIGMTDLLLRTPLDERQRHYASVAKLSGNALLCLINDILDFSKVEAGKVELETVEFDIQDILASILATFQEQADSKGLKLTGVVNPQTPLRICGDPGRLQQVLINLVSNAMKFTAQGEISVRVVVEHESTDQIMLRFIVNDTGIGIPSERMDRLFRAFSQVNASTTRRYGGTGLGLAICKRIVELMGGTIGVSSEPGLGSTFWFVVTLGRAAEAPTVAKKHDDFRYLRVLAIDDNETNREILVEQLHAFGMEMHVESDGRHALELLRAAAARDEPFGVAILDKRMPGMNGEQIALAIKSDPSIQDTVLILLSSDETINDDERLRELGFAAWTSKPINASRLAEIIASALACAARVPSGVSNFEPLAERKSDQESATRSMRILVADDNEIGRAVVTATLKEAGHGCDLARDGVEVVDAALTGNYDVIFMDCQMPNLDGFEATGQIRRHEDECRRKHIPFKRPTIIALTANAIKGDRERCRAAGMDDYLTKPFAPEDLMSAILRNIGDGNTAKEVDSDNLAMIGDRAKSKRGSRRAEEFGDESESAINDGAAFDIDVILKRWGGDREFACRLIQMFKSQVPAFIEKLRRHVGSGDHAETANTAHGLKGAAAYVSASCVRDPAEELERMGRAADLSGAWSCLSRIELGLERCLSFDVSRVELDAGCAKRNEDSARSKRGSDSRAAAQDCL